MGFAESYTAAAIDWRGSFFFWFCVCAFFRAMGVCRLVDRDYFEVRFCREVHRFTILLIDWVCLLRIVFIENCVCGSGGILGSKSLARDKLSREDRGLRVSD